MVYPFGAALMRSGTAAVVHIQRHQPIGPSRAFTMPCQAMDKPKHLSQYLMIGCI
jgi:hypothetical protein